MAGGSRVPLLVLGCLLVLRLVLLLAGHALSATVVNLLGLAPTWVAWAANLWIVPIDLVTLWVVSRLLRREGRTLRGLLFDQRVGPALGWGALICVALIVAYLASNFLGNLIAYGGAPSLADGASAAPPMWLALWSLLVLPVTVALAEEALYRGYLQPRLGECCGTVVGVVTVAVFFGLQHLGFTVGMGWEAGLSRVVTTAGAGLLLGILYLRRHRLASLVVAHWLLDVVGIGLPLLAWSLAG